MTSVRNTYFIEKIRPLNSRGDKLSQHSPSLTLLPLLTAFLLVTLDRYYSTGRFCNHRGHYQMETQGHQRGDQERVVPLSMLCLAFLSQT